MERGKHRVDFEEKVINEILCVLDFTWNFNYFQGTKEQKTKL